MTFSAGQKKGGQALLGGLNVTVHRNFFGSQVRGSFMIFLILSSAEGLFHDSSIPQARRLGAC